MGKYKSNNLNKSTVIGLLSTYVNVHLHTKFEAPNNHSMLYKKDTCITPCMFDNLGADVILQNVFQWCGMTCQSFTVWKIVFQTKTIFKNFFCCSILVTKFRVLQINKFWLPRCCNNCTNKWSTLIWACNHNISIQIRLANCRTVDVHLYITMGVSMTWQNQYRVISFHVICTKINSTCPILE